jgi:hypothetical protein
MAKIKQYKLVEEIEHLQPIIKKYREILINRNSNVFNSFSSVEYWYYFPKIDIFAPNKFLAYQEMANEPYPDNPKEYYGMDGGEAQKRLKKYFDEVTDFKEKEELKTKLKTFIGKYNQNIKTKTKMGTEIHILKINQQYVHLFTDDKIDGAKENVPSSGDGDGRYKTTSDKNKSYNINKNKQTIIHEVFQLILSSLVDFIKNTLMKYDKNNLNNLWKKYIYDKLPDPVKSNLPKEGHIDELVNNHRQRRWLEWGL